MYRRAACKRVKLDPLITTVVQSGDLRAFLPNEEMPAVGLPEGPNRYTGDIPSYCNVKEGVDLGGSDASCWLSHSRWEREFSPGPTRGGAHGIR